MPTNRKNLEMKPLFAERMQKLLSEKKDFQKYLDILKIPPVRSIRCNKLKILPSDLKIKLEEKKWKIKQPWKDYPEVMIVEGKYESSTSNLPLVNSRINKKIINKKLGLNKISAEKSGEANFETINSEQSEVTLDLEPGELGRALEHQLGYYYIQELASMLPVIALEPKKNELILDLCSAPGSKTTQLSSEMSGTGTIVANEVSIGRMKILASNLERCGAFNTIITKKDGVAFCKKLTRYNPEIKFDRILVDAPCSGEGTLRSSPKTYLMWNPKTIISLSKLQKQMVCSALEILKPNGTLVYSTCTHAPEENEGVANYILENFPDVKLEKIKLPIKTREGIVEWSTNFSPEVKKCARIYPQDNNTEGFFVAKFRRVK